jgi:serine/threonine protein kinase
MKKREFTLAQWIDTTRPNHAQILLVLGRLAWCLAWLHGQGLIHADIKPQNILVEDHTSPILNDYSLTSPCLFNNYRTPHFAPPEREQWQKNIPSDPFLDLHAFGITALEALSIYIRTEQELSRFKQQNQARCKRQRTDTESFYCLKEFDPLLDLLWGCTRKKYSTMNTFAHDLDGLLREKYNISIPRPSCGHYTDDGLETRAMIVTKLFNQTANTQRDPYESLFVIGTNLLSGLIQKNPYHIRARWRLIKLYESFQLPYKKKRPVIANGVQITGRDGFLFTLLFLRALICDYLPQS